MAEGVLGLAPIGTHTYSKFVTPDELRQALQDVGLHVDDVRGMQYSPLSKRWSLTDSTSMNYIMSAIKPPGERST
jgi:2-polyprenyl-6-hydroxyphenyl methylase/3-demethylubiquinone-9 3-methyltransferase